MSRVMTVVAIASTTICLVVLGFTAAADAAREPRMAQETPIDRLAEMAKILSVLDRKIDDPNARKHVVEKLVKLNDRQISLIASLAERMATDGDGAAAGIALLLIAALLIAP